MSAKRGIRPQNSYISLIVDINFEITKQKLFDLVIYLHIIYNKSILFLQLFLH